MTAQPSLVSDEFRLYRRLVAARIRSDWQYRTSFLLLMVSQSLIIVFELVALLFLIELVPQFGGWSRAQVVFLYAMATLPFSIGDVFISEVELLAYRYIRDGDFDVVLLRPTSALLQILALEFELRRAGKLLTPAIALAWSATNLDVDWTVGRIAALAVAVISGTAIYSGLWVIAGSIPFWAVASREATNAMTYGSQFANQYPLHIYPGWIRAIMGWALPLAFVAYVPAISLADAANPLDLPSWMAFTPPAVAVVIGLIARWVWRTGVAHYQSTGS
ncbi:MAG: ABC-2 family transporter protein [Acidimicrobiia bacterium]|nr:ABC-2 family transporter protein [Acidimicrobiia bacterium]